MKTFLTYIANTNGQKLSGFTRIEAASMQEARAEYRRIHAGKGIQLQHCEILAEVQ